jgi:MarR family transcriptional regulator, transcriptional regulator for hemolysin
MPPRPSPEPVGLELARTAKVLSRAFDDALVAVGGSLPTWIVLMKLRAGGHATQRELAAAVGIEGPTLTHHLHRMEAAGLLTRTRDPENRRVQRVELTEAGEAMFQRLLVAVAGFDERLRAGITRVEVDVLRGLLGRLRVNVATPEEVPA